MTNDELQAAAERVRPGEAAYPPYDAEQDEGATALLQEVYRQAGNSAPANRRHALTPGLRDQIRDFLHRNTPEFFGELEAPQ